MNQISTQIGYIVVHSDLGIYVGSQDRFNKNPQVFKVYNSKGRAESSSPIEMAKYRSRSSNQEIRDKYSKYSIKKIEYKIIEEPKDIKDNKDNKRIELEKELLARINKLDNKSVKDLITYLDSRFFRCVFLNEK